MFVLIFFQKLTCAVSYSKIKFKIDTNNDELFRTVQDHMREMKKKIW